MPKVLSSEAVAQFERDGVLPAIPVLTADEVAYFRSCLERFEAKYPDHVPKLKSKSHLLCPWVDEIARHPRILDVMEDLIGPDILCWTMGFRLKTADGQTFAGWHQDTSYNRVKPVVLNGALALTECSLEHGCLSAIPGTHKGPLLPHEETGDPNSILVRGQFIREGFDEGKAINLPLRPGEMTVFDNHIVHGSRPNTTGERRVLLLCEMMPAHARPEDGVGQTAMLVRGSDRFGHFGAEKRPDAEFGPAALAEWQRVMDARGKALFAGSKLSAYGAYKGLAAEN